MGKHKKLPPPVVQRTFCFLCCGVWMILGWKAEAFPSSADWKDRTSITSLVKDRLQPGSTVQIAFVADHNVDDKEIKHGLENPVYILGYWSIRGLAAPIRMMLSAAQVNHWCVLYDSDNGDETQYMNDKTWLQTEYSALMNLPFLIYHNSETDQDSVLTQTNAIMQFLGRELGMLGRNAYEMAVCEELLCELMDLRDNMIRFAYPGWKDFSNCSPDDREDAIKLLEGASRGHWDKLEAYLKQKYSRDDEKKHVCYLVGDQCSAPDFHLWEMMAQYEGLGRYYQLDESLCVWHQRPFLKLFFSSFQQLPENQAYMKSELLTMLPYNNPSARFGADPSSLGTYSCQDQGPARWMNWGVVQDVRVRR